MKRSLIIQGEAQAIRRADLTSIVKSISLPAVGSGKLASGGR
jgi:hypothetical protein